jgi:antitoxin component of MazEF toxin-antitoxin module
MEIPENDSVYISFRNQSVVISKEKRLTLKERLIEFYGEDYEEKCRKDYDEFRKEHGVVEWGPPVGKEIW